ncbi:MAG: TIGR02757 family protein [Treponema sp.]
MGKIMPSLENIELKKLLDEAWLKYEIPSFIEKDPISIPHRFSKKEDIETSAFLTSIISWGNRKAILKSASFLMELLENAPHDFVINATDVEYEKLKTFYYRTLNGDDMFFIVKALKHVYEEGGFESFFRKETEEQPLIERIAKFYNFFKQFLPERTKRHVASIDGGSAGKRSNMFLRWMTRSKKRGVDFGIWSFILPSELFLPLDVHVANIARGLKFTNRRQNDRKTVEEITNVLRSFCPDDPIKYDFALFSLDLIN